MSALTQSGTTYGDGFDRYAARWRDAFDAELEPFLVPNCTVLDIGAGRAPTVGAQARPHGCHYVGLDISEHELRLSAGAYDEFVVADITAPDPALVERFDLAISWDVLEHVRPLERALANIHSYLRPGGAFVAQLSGKFSAFGVANQLIPRRLGVRLLDRLLARDPRTVFPAYYDRCYASALERSLASWSEARVVPRFRGAGYFAFSRRLERMYLRYEDWAVRSRQENLATHYLIVARR